VAPCAPRRARAEKKAAPAREGIRGQGLGPFRPIPPGFCGGGARAPLRFCPRGAGGRVRGPWAGRRGWGAPKARGGGGFRRRTGGRGGGAGGASGPPGRARRLPASTTKRTRFSVRAILGIVGAGGGPPRSGIPRPGGQAGLSRFRRGGPRGRCPFNGGAGNAASAPRGPGAGGAGRKGAGTRGAPKGRQFATGRGSWLGARGFRRGWGGAWGHGFKGVPQVRVPRPPAGPLDRAPEEVFAPERVSAPPAEEETDRNVGGPADFPKGASETRSRKGTAPRGGGGPHRLGEKKGEKRKRPPRRGGVLEGKELSAGPIVTRWVRLARGARRGGGRRGDWGGPGGPAAARHRPVGARFPPAGGAGVAANPRKGRPPNRGGAIVLFCRGPGVFFRFVFTIRRSPRPGGRAHDPTRFFFKVTWGGAGGSRPPDLQGGDPKRPRRRPGPGHRPCEGRGPGGAQFGAPGARRGGPRRGV